MPALDLAALVLDRVLRLGEMVGTFAFVFDRVFKFEEMEGSFSFGAAPFSLPRCSSRAAIAVACRPCAACHAMSSFQCSS